MTDDTHDSDPYEGSVDATEESLEGGAEGRPDDEKRGEAPASPLAPQAEDSVLPHADFDERPSARVPAAEPPPAGAPVVDEPTTPPDVVGAAERLLSKEPIWPVTDYVVGGNFGGAAQKLSESFVAPLVAAARGYKTYDRDSIGSVFKDFALGDRRSKQARRLAEAVAYKDVLLMPWYAVDEVYRSAARAEHLAPSSIQFRPSGFVPGEDDGERKRKYEFVLDNSTPLSMHPSIPGHWIDAAPTVLIAEGLLKADAALTGWLLSKGVTREQLAFDGTTDARLRLQRLMGMIDDSEGLAICSIAGVYNWMQNPEWKMVSFAGREVWLGIDGDVATNPYVYKATLAFKEFLEQKKRATVSLLSPHIPTESEDGTTDEKIGIDDYLAAHGTWSQLLEVLSPTMPPKPADLAAAKGDVRVKPDGCSVEQYNVTETDANGRPVLGRWEHIVPLGGRIVATLAERVPSDAETRTGEFGKGVDETQTEWEVEIEVKFKSIAGEAEAYTISGPAKILNYLPDQWEGKGADIPAPILVHPEWPPRGKEGEAWLKAIKGNQPEKIIKRVRWASMGWVPVPGSIPAFIAGDHVIGGNEDETTEVLPGVTNEVLDRASGFGVGPDLGLSFDDEDFRAETKRAIESMLEVYVTNGTWRDRRNAAVVVAAGLRPALPLHMKALPYFVGARGTGKTFSAEAVMGFVQNSPGSLIPVPGSANDTAAHMELSISRSLIWTIDDVAPASSKRKSEDDKDKIGTLIRMYFNRTARGRSTATMGNRKKNLPRALLVITAENEPTVSSERDRVILCDIGYGALSPSRYPTDRLTEMIRSNTHPDSQAPAKCFQALVKYIRWCTTRPQYGSWSAVWKAVHDSLESQTTAAARLMDGGTKRHHDTAADLTVALAWLARVAQEVDCEEWVTELLLGDEGLILDIINLISEGQRSNSETSPGRALIEALSATLRRGKAHITLSDDPSAPPMVQDPAVCASLGWVRSPDGQTWRPAQGSDGIGWLMFDKKTGPIVMFDPRVAFSVAQQYFPNLIPHGQQERSSWAAVTGEGLGRKDLLRKEGDKTLNRSRIMSKGTTRSGYPVDLDRVLRGGLDEEDAHLLDGDDAA